MTRRPWTQAEIDVLAKLRAALYRTGRPQYDSRCDTCAHCGPAQRGSRYVRQCALHDARVKTHGVCQRWETQR